MKNISRKEVIQCLETNSIDIRKFHSHFEEQGGNKIHPQIFQQVFLQYVNQIGGVVGLFRDKMVELEINVLRSVEGKVIKYI